jgi:hypothetical protein
MGPCRTCWTGMGPGGRIAWSKMGRSSMQAAQGRGKVASTGQKPVNVIQIMQWPVQEEQAGQGQVHVEQDEQVRGQIIQAEQG